MSLIGLLIFVIVIGLIFYVLSVLPLPAPWKTIATVVACVIVLIVLLQMLGVIGGGALILRR
jgi:hypothetical protein